MAAQPERFAGFDEKRRMVRKRCLETARGFTDPVSRHVAEKTQRRVVVRRANPPAWIGAALGCTSQARYPCGELATN